MKDEVTIFGQTWYIEVCETLNCEFTGRDLDGLCKNSNNTIYIRKQKRHEMMQTLLHEFFHAVCRRQGFDQMINYDYNTEELMVENFATALVESFKLSLK